jgi:hypothetical protein
MNPIEVGSRAAAAKGSAGKADDVGLARSQCQQLLAVAADHDRGMRPLDGQPVDLVPGDAVMPTGKSERLAAHQLFDDRQGSGEAFNPGASAIEAQPRLMVFGLDVPSPQAELQATFAQEVDGRRLTRHQHRMAEIVVEHIGAEPKGGCRLGGADKRGHWRQEIAEVVGDRQHVIAESFDPAKPCWPNPRASPTSGHLHQTGTVSSPIGPVSAGRPPPSPPPPAGEGCHLTPPPYAGKGCLLAPPPQAGEG